MILIRKLLLIINLVVITQVYLCNIVSAEELIVTSAFGWRQHPISNEYKFHAGIDIGADEGATIPALFAGTVVYSDWYGGYGNCVIIQNTDGTYNLYGHCLSLNCYVGQAVNQGDIIAYVGQTGNSTGPHLHLEYWVNGQYVDPLSIWKKA